jgi:transketolase
MSMDISILSKAANESRGLAMDAVAKCKSGHLGLPLGAADMGAVLFGQALSYNPAQPKWINRDRFVLSAGHGSMFIYSWLHLSGYNLPLEELINFRQFNSKTPGHPESFMTQGVEATTGPLGQGVGNSVGLAVAMKMSEAVFNTPEHTILDSHVVCLAGDGCLQEGVAQEAVAFAGHQRLDNLILIFDSNDVTLDAMAKVTQSVDFAKQFEALGWDVQTVDGHDMVAFLSAFEKAKSEDNGKPKFIIAKTLIGKGIPEVAGTQKAHGEGGAHFVVEARKALGLPEQPFYVSDEVKDYFKKHQAKLSTAYGAWQQKYDAWKDANADKAELLENALAGKRLGAGELLAAIPEFKADEDIATRKAGSVVLQPLAKALPLLVSGSADLHGSTLNLIAGGGDFMPDSREGRNLRFGIREHAMGAIVNGFGYHGVFLASGATFLVFSDYLRPSIRLAALSHLPVFHIFTHDSVGVGEDGPTHQPVETVSALRLIPNLDVIRPADPEETAGAFVAAATRTDGPTTLILTRQNVKTLSQIPVETRRQGALLGGYIAKAEDGPLKLILLASGSEVQHAMAAAEQLGAGVRVVSMPCMERFDRQDAAYRESVLPGNVRKRVAIEAGVSDTWYKYVGLDGRTVAINRFGISAPGPVVMKELGMTPENLLSVAKSVLG